jgi:hypothetical protein
VGRPIPAFWLQALSGAAFAALALLMPNPAVAGEAQQAAASHYVLAQSTPATKSEPAQGRSATIKRKDESSQWPASGLELAERIQRWMALANRAFQTTVVPGLSSPPTAAALAELARRVEDVKRHEAELAAKRAEAERKAAEDTKAAEDKRQAAEDK